jgi:MoxR-like ATPase
MTLISLKKSINVYIEGEPGVGKTKLTEFIANLLGLRIIIFQMSANI